MASAEGLRRSVKGLSEIEFRERFGTEEACRKALFDMRWREGLACPACGHRGLCALKTRKLFQCNRCKKQVRLTAGTVFQDTKLPLTAWFTAIYHLAQGKNGISSIELGRRLGVKRQTAWLIKHKLMRAMGAREAEKPKLAGRVEVDDAYLGGERPGGKRGRGAAGKTPIVAAVETTAERRPRRLRLSVVKGFRKKEVERLAERDFAAGSNVVSDGLSCWPAVEKAGCQHFPMATGSGKRAASWAPFKWVNTCLGNIKTALAGTYHHVSAKHAQSYLTSFAYRFNRRFQLDSIVERLAWAAVHTAPQPIGNRLGCVIRPLRFVNALLRQFPVFFQGSKGSVWASSLTCGNRMTFGLMSRCRSAHPSGHMRGHSRTRGIACAPAGNGVRATRERRRAMRSGVALPGQFLMSPEAQFSVSVDMRANSLDL